MDSVRFLFMKDALLQRTLLFVGGLFIMAVGVDLSVKANLGVSPISSVPYVYSLRFPLTLGQTTIILYVLLIVLQILLLQKEYQWIQLVQIPVVLLFGWFIKFREQRVMQRYQVEPDEALKMMEASDRKRSNYCRHYTGREWGQVDNYNLTIQSSFFGIEQATEMVVQAIQQRKGRSRRRK
ncbi:DUF6198 family protein [Desulfosarcina variabilis]|uniref:DUF6198 family protein n=1 Tax=Desulfosarcina variabilis TaxID=2300 RepID=UPI003AFA65B7